MALENEEVARILASKSFCNAPQLSRFLRYLFEKTTEGRLQDLKESIIGVEVFGRKAGYDPRLDPVVRTEARRLRTKLAQYYATEAGTSGPRVVVDLPKGAYLMAFRNAGEEEPVPEAGRAATEPGAPWPEAAAPCPEAAPSIKAAAPWPEAAALLRIQPGGFHRWRLAAAALAVLCASALVLWGGLPGRHAATADSVSILPFETFGRQAESQYLAKGLALEIAGRLGRDRRLRVIEAGSPDPPPTQPEEIRRLGRRLNVAALLDGSLRQDGERLFITARLIDTADAGERWSQSYSISWRDLPAVESEITAGTFRGLGLVQAPPKKARQEAPVKPEIHDLYLRGRFLAATGTPLNMPKAFEEFREAIRLDPDSEWGYAGLADVFAIQISHRALPPERIPEARQAALAAIERDPESTVAHAALGLLHYCEWDWQGALDEYRRSLEINPNYAPVHHRLALVYFVFGRFDDAERELKRAAVLDPLALSHTATLSELYYYWRRQEDSIREAKIMLSMDPQSSYAHSRIGWSLLALGKYAEAEEEFRRANFNPWLAVACAARGDMRGARSLLKEFRQGPEDADFTASPMFWTLAKDREKALHALEEQYRRHDADIASAQFDPLLDPLRGEPRFQSLMARMGFRNSTNK